MATIILGQHPDKLEVRLTRGDSATLVATLTDSTGTVLDWQVAPTLEFANGRTFTEIVAHVATIDGEHASWTLTAAQVETIAAASPVVSGSRHTSARITLPDTDDATGSVEYAGAVKWSDGWSAGDRSQRVTFTLPGGPAGPAGRGVTSITNPDADATALVTYTDGSTSNLPLPSGGGGGSSAWADITGKPSTFAPSAHQHPWADVTGKPTTFAPSTHDHDDRYYTQAEVDALLEVLPTSGASTDHGEVGSTLTITEAGSHELDLTGDLAVTVSTDGDVSLRIHGTGAVTVAGQTFDIEDIGVILVVTWPRGQEAYLVGAVAAPVEPVEDPPTQPGTVTVDPTPDGFDLTWVASTVATGYEGSLDGGAYTDYGSNLTETLTGLTAGSEHSGAIRAYNTLGERSTARNWGPASVQTAGLHEILLGYDPEVYLRASQGALEDFSRITGTWAARGGMTTGTHTGPALVDGDASSLAMPSGTGIRRPLDGLMVGATSFTAIMVMAAPTAAAVGKNDLYFGNNIAMLKGEWEDPVYFKFQPGGVHTVFVTWTTGSGAGNRYLDGQTDSEGINTSNASPFGTPDSLFLNIHGMEYGGNDTQGGYLSYVAVLKDVTLTLEQRVEIAQAAGTLGNPAGGTL